MEDFKPCAPLTQPYVDVVKDFQPPYWEPNLYSSERIEAFVPRMLTDFCKSWGHIIRNQYNDQTFLRLGRAIVELATMNFGVYELIKAQHYINMRGLYIWSGTLPDWEPFDTRIMPLGQRECIVLSRDPAEAMLLIRNDADRQREKGIKALHETIYLVLSVRHVILCRVKAESIIEWSRPEKLFDKDEAPSERAFDLLLFFCTRVVDSKQMSCQTPIHGLPIELQDMILHYVSQGPLEGARVGCMLGLGTPFRWKDGVLPIEMEQADKWRGGGTRTESKLMFGEHFSGISYKGNRSNYPREMSTE